MCSSCSAQSLYEEHKKNFREIQKLLGTNDTYFRKEYKCSLGPYTEIRYIISKQSYENCFKGIDKEKDEIITSFLTKEISPTIKVYDDYIAFFIGGSSNFLNTEQEYIIYSSTKTDIEYMDGIEVIEFKKLEEGWYYAKTKDATY